MDRSTKIARPLPPNNQYEVLDLCEDFSRGFRESSLDYTAAPPFALEFAHRIRDLAHALTETEGQYLAWLPTAGTLRVECLNPAPWIAQCLQPFAQKILMSATLAPFPEFTQRCGLKPDSLQVVEGHAPWREQACRVAVDTRVDTRLKNRHLYFETTARSIAACIASSPGVPVAVFFSSYQYAENVYAYLKTLEPNTRAVIQPRGLELAEQEAFIESALLTEDALFLILGSSYAESIDALGGRVHTALVVGPALPEVNCVREARLEHIPAKTVTAFQACYLLRECGVSTKPLDDWSAPGHRATILLQGRRFAEAQYQQALAKEYQAQPKLNPRLNSSIGWPMNRLRIQNKIIALSVITRHLRKPFIGALYYMSQNLDWNRKDLIDLEPLSRAEIETIFKAAGSFKKHSKKG